MLRWFRRGKHVSTNGEVKEGDFIPIEVQPTEPEIASDPIDVNVEQSLQASIQTPIPFSDVIESNDPEDVSCETEEVDPDVCDPECVDEPEDISSDVYETESVDEPEDTRGSEKSEEPSINSSVEWSPWEQAAPVETDSFNDVHSESQSNSLEDPLEDPLEELVSTFEDFIQRIINISDQVSRQSCVDACYVSEQVVRRCSDSIAQIASDISNRIRDVSEAEARRITSHLNECHPHQA